MIKINLLPIREIKRRQKAKSQIFTFLFGLLLLALVLGLFAFYQIAQAKKLETELQGLKTEKQKYTKIINDIKELEADKAVLENQIMVIDQLKASSSLTVHLLDDIAAQTPEKRIWLTTLQQTGQTLTLTGMALDNRTVAQYMDDLRKSAYIKDVQLTDTSLKSFAGRDLKSFSLSCVVGPPAADAEEDQTNQ